MFCEAGKFSACPACGEVRCDGHSRWADPYGWGVVAAHDAGHHHDCDPRGCDEVRHLSRPCHVRRVLAIGEV